MTLAEILKALERGQCVSVQNLAGVFESINLEILLRSNQVAFLQISEHVTSHQELFDLTVSLSDCYFPFPTFIQSFLADSEDYGGRLKFLVAHGLRLSSFEVFVMGHLGVHVLPLASRELAAYDIGQTLKHIKHFEFCNTPAFINYVVDQICAHQMIDVMQQDLASIYSSVKDINGDWLNAFIRAGIKIDVSMLSAAILSGEECNLLLVMPFIDDASIASNSPSLFYSLSMAKFEDGSEPYQMLFKRTLESYDSKIYHHGAYEMLQIVLPRPTFMSILHKRFPEFLVETGRCLSTNFNHSQLFLTSLTRGFEGPDLFMKISGLELKYWFTEKVCASIDSESIICGLRYLVHHGKIESPAFKRLSPLFVLAMKIDFLTHNDAVSLTQAFLTAGANIYACLDSKTPLDHVLASEESPRQVKVLSLLIKAGAPIDHVAGIKNCRLIRMALWDTSIKYILLGLADPGSSINQNMNGLNVGNIFSFAILGSDQ